MSTKSRKNSRSIRKFGERYIAIRKPSEAELRDMEGKIRVSENTWVDDIRPFEKYRPLFAEKSIYLISNRYHYEKKHIHAAWMSDIIIDKPWPIFTINYSIKRVPRPLLFNNRVFSFWQDNIPRPVIDGALTVFGPLIPNEPDIRISTLAMGFPATPKTLILALTVAESLGVEYVRMFDFNPKHPVNQMLSSAKRCECRSKHPKLAHITIDLGGDLGIY